MTGIASGLFASIGMALVITALVRQGTKSAEVIDSVADGVANIMDSSLGR